MLSLVGSIQHDPFPIEDEYWSATTAAPVSSRGDRESISPEDVEAMLEDEAASDSDEEPFDAMNRIANETVSAEAARKSKKAEELKAEKKRKRKSGKANGDAADSTGKKLKI